MDAMKNAPSAMGVGGMGGGSPDGAQITFVRLKPGAMKSVCETEKLVARWRDVLTTIGLAAFPHVMERDQLLLNTQEGWRVPDMKEFALEQPEVKYFEHSGNKFYAEGVDPNELDPPGRSEEEVAAERDCEREQADREEKRRAKRLAKSREKSEAKKKLREQLGLATEDEEEEDEQEDEDEGSRGEATPSDATAEVTAATGATGVDEVRQGGSASASATGTVTKETGDKKKKKKKKPVIHGGWSPDWTECSICKRACHVTACAKCSIDRISADELTREQFVKEYVASKNGLFEPFIYI
jgi:hypothetical protein